LTKILGADLGLTCGYRVFVCSNMAFAGDFTPVLAKHSKSFSLVDSVVTGSAGGTAKPAVIPEIRSRNQNNNNNARTWLWLAERVDFTPHPLFMFARTAAVVCKMARSAARHFAGWGARSALGFSGGYVALQQRVEKL
jgi:hypothetical protein